MRSSHLQRILREDVFDFRVLGFRVPYRYNMTYTNGTLRKLCQDSNFKPHKRRIDDRSLHQSYLRGVMQQSTIYFFMQLQH